MALKRKKKDDSPGAVAVPQTAQNNHPFKGLLNYNPQSASDRRLYKELRKAIPIIDAAIFKLVRLIGNFEIKCENENVEKELNDFLLNVNVGSTRKGITSFLGTFFEEFLTYGTAVGEICTNGREITHLFNSELRSISLSYGENPAEIVISADTGYGVFKPVKYPELILLAVRNPEPGEIYGTSILKSLPFVSDVLLKIYNTIGLNWERVGNVRFAVTYKPQNDSLEKAYAKERAMQVAEEWKRAMESSGAVKDFVAVGDVNIKSIGSDNQILDSDVPVRQMLEQIVSALGVPPFLLGLSWSTTERMSYQQSDILTSEIDSYRKELEPIIFKITDLWLRLHGYDEKFEIAWDDITLQDISELAKARLYEAQAQQLNEGKAGETID